MTTAADRREHRAALRADRDGSGPTLAARAPVRYPGATAKFALLGEVLLTGLLVTFVSLAIVTFPAALAAGVRHLRRYIRAEASPQAWFWADVRRGLAGGSLVGIGAAVLAVVLLIDVDLARSGALPGGGLIGAVGGVGLAALAVVVLTAAGQWSPEHGWRGALRSVPRAVRTDVAGAAYLLATAGFVAVATWALLPLIIPALGCAALAIVAIPERPRRSSVDGSAPR